MNLELEDVEAPVDSYGGDVLVIESYIREIICHFENPDAELIGTFDDFPLLDILVVDAYAEHTPKDIREIMLRGVIFSFSEILYRNGYVWCKKKSDNSSELGMRRSDSTSIIYIFDILEKYMEESDEIDLKSVYWDIEEKVSLELSS